MTIKEKMYKTLYTLRVDSKTLPSFALGLRPQFIVTTFGKSYGHYQTRRLVLQPYPSPRSHLKVWVQLQFLD